MKFKNCVIGQRVKTKQYVEGFYSCNANRVGVITKVWTKDDSYNIEVRFDEGGIDSGNHKDLKKVKGDAS